MPNAPTARPASPAISGFSPRVIEQGGVLVRSKRGLAAAAIAMMAIMVLAALFATPAPVQAISFVDVSKSDWFADAVGALSDAGIVAGRADGTFGPDDPVTRAEFAVLVVRCLGIPPVGEHPFVDFPRGVWFEPFVAALYQSGLTTGLSPTEYGPYKTISRQQAVSLAVRALAYRLNLQPSQTLDLNLAPAEVEEWLQGFYDRTSISGVHRQAVANAWRLQLLTGQSQGGFRPLVQISRAETAAVLYAALLQTPVPLSRPPDPVPAVSTIPVAPPVSPPPSSVPAYQSASSGSQGAHVLWIEQRLAELTYRPGPVDGVYDERTRQAVIAFQKWEGLDRSGSVGPETWARLLVAGVPTPRMSASGTWIEVSLSKQVFLYVQNGAVVRALPTSTGRSFSYHSTPYAVQRKPIADGPRYRALYLNPGNVLAIHGYKSVPVYAASDGCIRLTKWDMDDLRAADAANPMIPDGTKVYVY
jgi:peptidoglycan hydrolase-like protein with peptidoglycan-binding domain